METIFEKPESNQFLVDFLTVSFDRNDDFTPEDLLHEVCYYTGLDRESFSMDSRGAMTGYNRSYKHMGRKLITINWHEDFEHQGVNVNFTGQGCKVFTKQSILKFFKFVKQKDARITRIDVAYDDVEGVIPYDHITEAFSKSSKDERHFASRSNFDSLELYYHNHLDGYRFNVSFGSRQSSVRFRLYDKAHEQKLKGVYWRRFEFTLKYEHAETMIDAILADETANVFAHYLEHYCRVLERPTRPDKTTFAGDIKTSLIFQRFLDFLRSFKASGQFQKMYILGKIKEYKGKYRRIKFIELELILRMNYYFHRQYGRFLYLRDTFPDFFSQIDLEIKGFVIDDEVRALETVIYNAISKPLC